MSSVHMNNAGIARIVPRDRAPSTAPAIITVQCAMIEGRRVNLRPAREDELALLYDLEHTVAHRGPFGPLGVSSFVQYKRDYEKCGFWFDDGGGLVISDKEGRVIGKIGCRRNGVVLGYEVGYVIFREEDRGKGYMGEALELFTAYMFAWKDIPRLYLLITPQNAPSVGLAEKVGYVKEGLMRRAIFVRGAYNDLAIYAILRDEAHSLMERSLLTGQ